MPDKITSRPFTAQGRDNWDRIFNTFDPQPGDTVHWDGVYVGEGMGETLSCAPGKYEIVARNDKYNSPFWMDIPYLSWTTLAHLSPYGPDFSPLSSKQGNGEQA